MNLNASVSPVEVAFRRRSITDPEITELQKWIERIIEELTL